MGEKRTSNFLWKKPKKTYDTIFTGAGWKRIVLRNFRRNPQKAQIIRYSSELPDFPQKIQSESLLSESVRKMLL